MDDKIDLVFSELRAMARVPNCKSLTHWALIQNISNYARGVGRSAESAAAYFKMTLSNTTRWRLFSKLAGNNKIGRAGNNTLRERQLRMFQLCTPIIFTYDNYQRGLTL